MLGTVITTITGGVIPDTIRRIIGLEVDTQHRIEETFTMIGGTADTIDGISDGIGDIGDTTALVAISRP